LLILVAVGLFGYALWRLSQAWIDPEGEGRDAKGVIKRIGYAISGAIYGFLGVEAVRIVMGSSSGSGGEQQAEDWTAQLLAQPFGQWLVAIVGVILIGTGLYQGYRAYSAKFKQKLKLNEMSVTEQTWAVRSGRLGFAARGVVYLLLGGFLIQAALTSNPEEAGGIGQALRELVEQPYGPWLLGLVAAGLVAYGFFCFVLARYRRIFIR
jgi:type IV secretory pathway VirB2 component (pilin)